MMVMRYSKYSHASNPKASCDAGAVGASLNIRWDLIQAYDSCYNSINALVGVGASELVVISRKAVVLGSLLVGLLLKVVKITLLRLKIDQLFLEDCNLSRLITCGLPVGRTRFFQLGVLSLDMNKVQEDVECPCENNGQEQGEAGKVHISLCVKLARSEVSLGTHVMHALLGLAFLRLCREAQHALNRINKEDGDKYERYFQTICEFGNQGILAQECEELFPHGEGKWKDQDTECGHLRDHKEEGESVVNSHG